MVLLENLCLASSFGSLSPPLPPLLLQSFPFSLAAVNLDVYTGSSTLASACRVPGVLSAVRDVRQQTGMAWPAGRAVLDGSAVSVVDRQACGSDLPVTGCQSCRRATYQHAPLSSHLTTDRGEALNSQLGTQTPLLPAGCCTVRPLLTLTSYFAYEVDRFCDQLY